jgi:hypothetical protein
MEKKSEKLSLLLEEVDENKPVEQSLEEEKVFEKHKRKRSVIVGFLAVSMFLLVLAGLALSAFSELFNEKRETISINDYSEFQKGKLTGNILGAMNERVEKDLKNDEIGKIIESPPVKQKRKHSGRNLNTKKDEEILAKYASAIDPAASGNVISGNPRAARRHFVPGSDGGGSNRGRGGVFIKGEDKESKKESELGLHNVKIRTRLEFSIRSTASGTVVAVVTEGNDKIPQGSKFYGSASGYANKRTQLRFDRVVVDGVNYSVKGFAIQGRDPGIESEVTDISKDNLDPVVKQGIAKTLSGVAVGVAGGANSIAGEAAGNTINPASNEVQRQQDAHKMRQEYRVPAGTSFFVYLE